MKKIIIPVILILLVVLAAFKLMASREKNTSQKDNINVDVVMVSVSDVSRKSASAAHEFVGALYPVKELDIPAEIQGRITSLNLKLGQSVGAGSVIATIDDRIKKINVETAKVDLQKKQKDLRRVENLYKGGTATEQEYDNAVNSVTTAQIKLDEAEKQLAYTRITSSIGGTITKKNVELGTYVNPGSVIASVVDISRLKIKLKISESNVYQLKIGDRVKVKTDIYPGAEFSGTTTFISPYGDASHNYAVEIEMDNSRQNPLKAGTFVKVNFHLKSDREALFIPRAALQGSVKEAKVYVINGDRARLKSVTIGNEENDYLEVLSGVNEGDKVVVSGQVNLTDNKKIKIINN